MRTQEAPDEVAFIFSERESMVLAFVLGMVAGWLVAAFGFMLPVMLP